MKEYQINFNNKITKETVTIRYKVLLDDPEHQKALPNLVVPPFSASLLQSNFPDRSGSSRNDWDYQQRHDR